LRKALTGPQTITFTAVSGDSSHDDIRCEREALGASGEADDFGFDHQAALVGGGLDLA